LTAASPNSWTGWKREKIYIESDAFGVTKMTMVGYLTKIHQHLANQISINQLLQMTLKDVTLDADLAVKLDPMLKNL